MNNVPRACASKVVRHFAKIRALQLAAGNMHGPDNSSVLDPQSEVKYSSQGYALVTRPQTQLGSGYARLDMLSLILRSSGIVFVIHEHLAVRLLCWGKNGQGKSLEDTLHKSSHSTIMHKSRENFVCQERHMHG